MKVQLSMTTTDANGSAVGKTTAKSIESLIAAFEEKAVEIRSQSRRRADYADYPEILQFAFDSMDKIIEEMRLNYASGKLFPWRGFCVGTGLSIEWEVTEIPDREHGRKVEN